MILIKKVDNRTKFLAKKHAQHPSHLHFNAITEWNGEVLGLFHGLGVIVNIDREEIIFQDERLKGAHNLVIKNNALYVNNSYGKEILVYDIPDRKFIKEIKLTHFPEVKKMVGPFTNLNYYLELILKHLQFIKGVSARPYFIRGLDIVDNLLFVGLSPASILCLNLDTYELIDSFHYSQNIHVAVHGLRVWR